MSNGQQNQPVIVQSLERGLRVMRAFSAENSSLTLAEAARLTGLTRATVRRSLQTLQHLGYAVTDGKQYELTPRVLDLGFAYLSSAHISEVAEPYMTALSEEINESVSIAVLDQFQIIYVARVSTKRIMRNGLALGSRLPALTTSMGRMIIADLPVNERAALVKICPVPKMTNKTITNRSSLLKILEDIHVRGWALLDQELEEGVRSIAAPIRDKRGNTIAAVNIGTQIGRTTMKKLNEDFLPLLIETASSISSDMKRR